MNSEVLACWQRHFAMLMIVISLGQSGQAVQAIQPEQTDWRTGAELDQFLKQPISVAFNEVPLRARLDSFARQQRVAIFVDRRLDPGTPISLSLRNVTIEQLLWTIAAEHGWGVCRLDNFFYVGPTETAESLPLLFETLKDETRAKKGQSVVDWGATSRLRIEALSAPEGVLEALSRQGGFRIFEETLPHDLWPELELPAISMDQQVALLVIGFAKWFERSADGTAIRLIALPAIENGELNFGEVDEARQMQTTMRKEFPDCRISLKGKSLVASGSGKDLAAIKLLLVKAQRALPVANQSQRRFTLTTQSSRGNILATIASQTGRKLEFDGSLNAVLGEQIKLSVKEVTLDDLLEQTLAGSGLTYLLDEDRLVIQ